MNIMVRSTSMILVLLIVIYYQGPFLRLWRRWLPWWLWISVLIASVVLTDTCACIQHWYLLRFVYRIFAGCCLATSLGGLLRCFAELVRGYKYAPEHFNSISLNTLHLIGSISVIRLSSRLTLLSVSDNFFTGLLCCRFIIVLFLTYVCIRQVPSYRISPRC